MGMNQFVEKNLSLPRVLDCCSSSTKTFAWNISIHAPFSVMSMGRGVEFGSVLVPEEPWYSISWMKSRGCMSIDPSRFCCSDGWSAGTGHPGIDMPGMHGGPCFPPSSCAAPSAGKNRSNTNTPRDKLIVLSINRLLRVNQPHDTPTSKDNEFNAPY